MRRLIVQLIVVLAVLLIGQVARAAGPAPQSADPITLEVRAGFDGYLQSDGWVPVTITASNSGDGVAGDLRVSVEGFTASNRTIYTRPIDLPRGSRKLVTLYPADLGSFGNVLNVELVRRGTVLASEQVRVQYVPSQALLVGLLSDTPQSLGDIAAIRPSNGDTKVAVLTVDDLPPLGAGWTSLDVLVVSDVDTGQFSADQQTALRSWVFGGGRLIIVGGPGYPRTMAGLQAVSPLLPQDTEEASLLPLTAAAGLPLDNQIDSQALVAVGTIADGARVIVSDGDVPLLVTHELGYGRVDFLAADPALEPLRSWPARTDLWRAILSQGEARPGWAFGFGSNWESAQQAAAAVPGIRLPNVLQLCGFLAVYVVLIGPVNYFVLWRLKRRELAWITIPLLVLLFSGIAYITGFQLRGSEVIVHRLAVVHSWAGRDTAEVQSLVGIWSPRRARYDIEVESGYLARPMPQNFAGGLSSVIETTIEEEDPVTLRRVQVDVGSVQPFVIEGFDDQPLDITASLTLEPGGAGLHVEGDITNRSTESLTDVSLIVAGTAQQLADLPAGGVLHVDTVLSSGRALPSGGLAYDPIPYTTTGYYAYYYDPLVQELAHTSDCYSDYTADRRCDLVLSILQGDWRGSGVVLTGWAENAPVELQVLNGSSRSIDMTLHIVELEQSTINPRIQLLEIPPGLMTWQLVSDPNQQQGYVSNPYDFYLTYGDAITFHFQPIAVVPLPDFTSMDIHLEAYYDTQSSTPRLSILNLETGQWDEFDASWGTTRIDDAQPYVDGDGGVTLSLAAQGGEPSISRFDVTLYGE